jgi:hypothetical protein
MWQAIRCKLIVTQTISAMPQKDFKYVALSMHLASDGLYRASGAFVTLIQLSGFRD